MAEIQKQEGFDLRITPEGTVPPFQTATELLNAVLPHCIEEIKFGFVENPQGGFLGVGKSSFSTDQSRFFPDGIVGLGIVMRDDRGYKKFIEGRAKSYPRGLRAVMQGVMVSLEFRSTTKFEQTSGN